MPRRPSSPTRSARGTIIRSCSPSPRRLLNVKVDGRRTYFEWLNAGHYAATGSRGTMSMVADSRIADVYFGFDAERLFLRFDTAGGTARERLADVDTLKITFLEPAGYELLLARPGWQDPIAQLYHNDVAMAVSGVEAAADTILEVAIPFSALAVSVDAPVQFAVELLQGEQSIEQMPHEGAIETTVPSPDYEMIMWQA